MHMFLKIICSGLILNSVLCYAAPPILSITPAATSVELFSGAGEITYTVQNNANKAVNKLTTPTYQTTGSPNLKGISVINNNCQNITLPSGGSCTFQLSMQSQTSAFSIVKPIVCIFGGAACSAGTTPVQVTISSRYINPHPLVYYTADPTDNYVTLFDDKDQGYFPLLTGLNFAGGLPIGVAVDSHGSFAYVANQGADSVVKVQAATYPTAPTIEDTINLAAGAQPVGVALLPDSSKVYVANYGIGSVSVIAGNVVIATVNVGSNPMGVAATPDGSKVYVANFSSNTVSVIDTATDTMTKTINVGNAPIGVAVSPDGTKVYVSNNTDNTISVISTATDTVVATISASGTDLNSPEGLVVSPDGATLYVANAVAGTSDPGIAVINTTTNTVVSTITLPYSNPLGLAITPTGDYLYVAYGSGSSATSGTKIKTSDTTDWTDLGVTNTQSTFGNFVD